MTKKAISPGAVHSVPADLRKILISDPAARAKWEDITPLARNEWICWVISVKKPETRRQHIERVRTELKEGMRRPCCQAVLTAEIRDGVLVFDIIFRPLQRTGSSLSIPKSRTSAQEAGALASHVVSHFDHCRGSCFRRLRTVGSTPRRFRHIHFASNGLCGSQVGTSGQ
jgi:Bacteriocin-protection, YdeI or OmpD-Associated